MTSIENIKENVDRIQLGDKTIYLVGTAHISQVSADLVENTIHELRPDSVAIELCESRYQSLQDPERWKNTDIVAVIRQNRTHVLLMQLILSAFQKKLGAQLNIKPGAEMMSAARVAAETGAKAVMADRDVRTTLKRCWASMGLWSISKLMATIFANLFSTQEIDAAEIERLKSSDALEDLMHEFAEKLPDVRNSLITERDQYLAMKIKHAPGATVVGVVGVGHVAGIKRYIEQEIDLAPLEVIPPPAIFGRVMNWGFLFAVLGIVIYGFINSGLKASFEMAEAWVVVTGLSAALGSALALAHPLTTLSALVSAPFTTIHPVLASGWVAGLVEAMIKKPRVADFETIADDMVSVRRIYQNRLSRIFLVFILTNLFGAVGALIAFGKIASMM